eukprot:GHRQ01014653.1.p2 GENE.GHRQ01014653.1~~GHRQ01014653.1.p2  ORF type:complete len:143 (+),score=5.36 GHRQ01014653.1:1708-2136(+)
MLPRLLLLLPQSAWQQQGEHACRCWHGRSVDQLSLIHRAPVLCNNRRNCPMQPTATTAVVRELSATSSWQVDCTGNCTHSAHEGGSAAAGQCWLKKPATTSATMPRKLYAMYFAGVSKYAGGSPALGTVSMLLSHAWYKGSR